MALIIKSRNKTLCHNKIPFGSSLLVLFNLVKNRRRISWFMITVLATKRTWYDKRHETVETDHTLTRSYIRSRKVFLFRPYFKITTSYVYIGKNIGFENQRSAHLMHLVTDGRTDHRRDDAFDPLERRPQSLLSLSFWLQLTCSERPRARRLAMVVRVCRLTSS